jgi:RHS repeat-associated protein
VDFPILPPILLEDGSSLLGVDQTLMATAPSMLAPTTLEVAPQVTPLTLSSPSNFLAPVSAAASDNLANQSDSLLSTPLLVNPEAANFSFSDQDTSWLGTPQISQLDDLGEVLVVPGNPSERVNMVVQWTLREAAFNNEVGFFLVDALGGVEGIAPGEEGFAEAALSSPSRQTLFNSGNQAGNWREFTVAGGSRLGFYVIQNSTSANWLENNRQNQGQSGLAFFSLKGANPDNFDHSQSSHLGRGIWRLNWEDLTGGGDQDFNDVVFNIAQAGIVLAGDKGQQVPLTVEAVSQDNTFPNEMGYYLVDTPDGEINGIKPGDQGYLAAALSGDRHKVIFASGKAFDSKTFNVPSGKYLGWYLVANGTTDQAIAKGENAPPVFFSYAAANEDGLNHVHAQQDSQTWAWEDFWGGGDRDFNDLVFRFSFGEPIGEPIQLPSLSIENTTVTEGNTGTQSANFTVRLSAPTNTIVTAQFTTTDGTAQAGKDYESSTGILTFAPGEVEKKIAVAVKGDTISEPTETFTVNLTGVTNAILIQGEGIGTILDNDNSLNPSDNNPPVTDADKTITLPEDSQPIPLNINPPTDIDGDTLTVSVTQLPDNTKGKITLGNGTVINVGDEISINSLTSLLYTPLADVNGNGGNFVYTVSDGKGGNDSQTISFIINPSKLIVSAVPSNNAPEFTTNPELEIIVGNDYSYDANAVDADNDTLFYSLSLAPDGLTIDNNTGILSWKSPTIGNYNISISVEDGKGGKDTQTYILGVVTNVIDSQLNRPPVFVSNPVVYGNLNSEYRYDTDATDADNDNLTYSVINAPNGLVINQNTGVVTFTPTVSGATEITLQVNDGKGGIATQIYTLSVLEEATDNYAPVIISDAILKASTSQNYVYDVNAIDPDKDILTYSLVNAPQGMSIDNLTGEIIWDTEGKTVGNYNVSVKVTDNLGGVDTQEFVIALSNTPLGKIEGVKWEDANGNGIWESANFEDFSVDVSSLILSGDTAIVDNALRLSLNSFYSSGNALLKNPFNLVRDSNQNLLFSTNFKFSISESSGLGDEDGEGADGIAFIISPTDTIGSAGGGIGYEGLNNTVVIELDTFNNGSQDQNNGNHIGINVNGSTTSFVQANIPTRFNNGEIWNVWIDYNGSSQLLEARVSQDSNRPTQATVSATVNIAEILGQNEFFVGFTSATGAGLGNHDILSWTFINNEPALEGITVYLDSNNNGTFDNNEPSQITDENGKYQFTGLEAGTYIVREVIPTDYEQTYPGGQPTDSLGDGFADVILDYFNSGAGTFDEPYGVDNNGNGPVLVNLNVILGNDNLGALSLPTGSFVTVGFIDEFIVDKPGNDIFIPEVGAAGERAEVYVSSNLKDFVLLGVGNGGTTSLFDLASIGFSQPVRAIKIVGLDNGGTSPGFDVINVQGLPGSIASPDFHTVQLKAGETVSNINFGNIKIDQPIPNQAPVFTSTAPTTAQIGQLLTYRATATDANNDRLTYSLLNQPEGMAVDAETGILIWQPKQNQIGNNRVVLRVSDGKGGIANQEFFLNTKGINTPPQIISSPNTLTLINNTYSYEVKATDFDNDTLTYSLINPPEGMTINANTGLIAYTPTKLGKQTVEIKVSDGFGGTNTQSYQLQVLATLDNNLPSITSTPKIIIGAGGLYQYDVEANDPENTAISYNLTVKPNGMTIDTNTGLITWQTQAVTNGDVQVTVAATDADGGIAYQNYYIRVTPNQAPIINSQPLELAQLGVTYKYDVIAKDADNDALTYNLLQAPQGLTIDQFGRIRWQSASQNQGIYPVTIQVSDGRGGITTQTYNLTLSNNDITNPVVELGFNSNLINIGESINFQVRATDNIEVKTLTVTANKTPLTLNPNTPNGQINTATFVGQKAGVYQIVATATDAAGNQDTETIEVRVLDPSDTEAPVIDINKTNLEATQGIIKSPTDIIATITDDNLEFYRVEIAPIEAVDLSNIGENDPDYTLLTKGTQNITNQQVATLDPRLLANGSYLVKITAFDFSGNGNVQGVILNVTGQNKPGDFSLEYTDLSIPLTGIPIEIIRRYNSLESASQGDFGYGWDLGLQDAKIVESSPDGRDLSEANSDLFGTSNTFSVGTRVTLNTPDGRRVGFTFNPVPVSASFFGAIYAPSFTPDAGVFDKLETENSPLTIRSDGTVGAFLFSFLGYNPSQYKLTTKDGTVYNYDQNFGLIDVTDRNGNKLTFSDDGIVSSTGAEIDFIRDGQGRITEIIDPDGKSIKYSYDSNGDLIEVIDRTNNTTELVYNDPNRQHFLTEIIDPLGRSATRTEYDENGQISKIIDANGNELNIAFNNATNSQTIRDPFGNNITRVFDAQGNVIQEVDQLGGITLRTYDEDNNLLSETDPEGNITSYTYDNRGNKLTETDGEGNKKTFTYNDNNDILTETTALGFVTNYTYDNNGNLTKREDTEGNVTEYEYDALGLLTTVTDANGKKSTFKYDNRGNLTELTDPTGAKTTFTYDSNGRVASVTDALGAITNYIYDAQGRLIEKADPEGSSCGCARGITKTEYNAAAEKIAEIDALGRRTEYRYNDRGLLIETILPDSTPDNLIDNPRTKNEYDALDRLTGFIDELGRKTIYVYDALGREIEVIYPDSTPDNLTDNPRTKKEYDKAWRKIAQIDELGNRTEYDYDKSDRLLTVTNALNQITSYTYDADGRQIAKTDALGRITEYDYDDLDRLLTTTYANNAVMTTTYDPLGRVIAEKDLAGNTTNYEYDTLGRLTAVIDALNQRTEYKYDLVGNLIEQKDANGNITKFEYDSLRRLKATILPGGQRNETIHDKIGNLIKVTDFNGAVTTYKYNERNWLTEKSFSDSTPTETFTYTLTGELATVIDNRGVTNYVYDERDRLISRTEPDNRTISYSYDKASNILTLTVPSGTTNYTYDKLNRIDTVKDADNGVTDYDYDAVGNLIKTVFPNGVTENQQYDLLNRLTYLENRNSTGIISSYTYTLDAMGNRVKVVENDGRTVEYTYDNLYRLTQEKITDTVAGNKTITYVFDAVGNRLEKVDSVAGKTTYTYDKNDKLLKEILGGNVTQYQYDEEGNLLAKVENGATTASYEWNAKGELTAVEVTENGEIGRIEFEYDHNGIRVAIDVDGEVTRFLIDNNQQQYAQVIEEYQTNGTVNTTYTHGWDLISQDDGTNRIYYHVDGLGSTRLITGNDGAVVVEYDYDAYGNLTRKVGDADNNYLFAGEQFDDAVDGYYLRARYYDPNTGRFASVDPFEGFNNQPITLHDYLYAGVNPVNAIDPSGEVVLAEKGILTAGIAGAILATVRTATLTSNVGTLSIRSIPLLIAISCAFLKTASALYLAEQGLLSESSALGCGYVVLMNQGNNDDEPISGSNSRYNSGSGIGSPEPDDKNRKNRNKTNDKKDIDEIAKRKKMDKQQRREFGREVEKYKRHEGFGNNENLGKETLEQIADEYLRYGKFGSSVCVMQWTGVIRDVTLI